MPCEQILNRFPEQENNLNKIRDSLRNMYCVEYVQNCVLLPILAMFYSRSAEVLLPDTPAHSDYQLESALSESTACT